jgi:signal transduction histidine kinase/ActR/RegA family two-component response regulator
MLSDDTNYSFTLKKPTVYKTEKLVFSYKKLILSISVFYLFIGFSIFASIDVYRHPSNTILSVMSLVSNSISFSNQYYLIGAWILIFSISMMLVPYLPSFLFRKLRLSQIAFPVGNQGDNLFDLISGHEGEINEEDKPVKKVSASKSSLGNNDNGMMMVADGKIMFINKEFCQLTGYAPVEVIGKDVVDFIVTADLPKYAFISRIPKDISPNIQGIGLITANNRKLEAYIAGNKNSAANPNDICLFYLKEKEVDLGKASPTSTWFMDSIENTNTCVWIWDDRGLVYMNSSCRELIPVHIGALMRKPLLMLKTMSKADRKNILSLLGTYLLTKVFDEEIKIETAEGEIRWLRVRIRPEVDNNAAVVRHVGIAYDITEQRMKYDEMEVAFGKAVTANNNKTAFLANMSHEIRSPLNGILGFSELLVDPDLPKVERERYIDIIKNNGAALLSILTDIIDISKLESGKMKIQEKEFLPAELMSELQMQFANDPLVTHKGLTLKWLIGDDIAGARLISDSFRFRQILVNLITNALKFTNKGRIEVVAERWEDLAVFYVKDTGIGIPEESLPFVFDRYRQVTKTDSTNITGFGLGLAICKALVELLGGNIWVESKIGHGSVFYFTIPYTTPKLNEMNNMNPNETAFPYDWKGRTILIAEDIDFSFLYIEAVLRRTGAKVLWAQNGHEAIEMVKVNPGIDIALMDIHMPIMNGYDATREIVKIRPGLPVIAQTAFVLPDDVKACYSAGCAGYLAKPIRREQLLNTLTDYFEKIDQNAQVEAGNMPVYRSKIS